MACVKKVTSLICGSLCVVRYLLGVEMYRISRYEAFNFICVKFKLFFVVISKLSLSPQAWPYLSFPGPQNSVRH